MHSLGLAPTPGNAGRGGGMQSRLQYMESALTTWSTAILPAASKWEVKALWVTQYHRLAVSD